MSLKAMIKKYWWLPVAIVGAMWASKSVRESVEKATRGLRATVNNLLLEAGKAGLDVITSPVAAAGQWLGEQFYPPVEVQPYAGTITPDEYYALPADQQRAMRERILKGEIKVNWK